jgi:hypothetical protein
MKNGLIFPFKTTWRERLDLDYLDETSARKVAARGERHTMRKVDQADPSAIGKSLKQFADYASKETIGQVHAGGFLHHLIVLNPDGTRSAPAALTNSERKKRITEEWFAHMRKWQTKAKNPVIQHRLIFTMSTPFHDKLVAAGLNPDSVLQGTLRKMMRQFQERFHPGDSIGYAYGIHHDTDHLHVHVALCPRTKKGVYVGCSTSRTRSSGNRNQIEYLMNCFERENRIWEKRLSDPLKLHQTLAKRLDSDRQTIVSRITARQQTALKRDQSLYATRLRYGYQAILDLETALQKKRQAQRAVRLLRRVPKLFGRRRPAPIRTIQKVAGAIEKMSIRELQAQLCRMKQSYRADHHIYCQHYGDPILQTHAHQNTHVQVQRTHQSL